MPSFRDLYPEKWLKPSVLGNARPRVTIENIHTETLFNPATKKNEVKLIAKFRGKDLQLILNKTAATTLAAISGSDDYSNWRGLTVMLSVTKAQNGKDTIVIGATSSQPPPSQPQAETRQAAPNPSHHDDVNFGTDDDGEAEENEGDDNPWETPIARPQADNSTARPVNNSDGPCPECHAPVGKPHASSCTAVGSVAARPVEPAARPVNVDARPQQASIEDDMPEADLYAELASLAATSLSVPVKDFIRKLRNSDTDSTSKMSAKYFESMVALLAAGLSADPIEEVYMLLTAILGYPVAASTRPGQLVHGHIVKPLRDGDDETMKLLHGLLLICRDIALARME